MKHLILVIIFGSVLISCNDFKANNSEKTKQQTTSVGMDTITLAAGCFWCVEAIFQDIKGVETVVSGYANGTVKNPSYKEVCSGRTGHAEVVQLTYNPQEVSLTKILEVFFQTHDPTTLNRQGGDVGTQYRSGIYYQTEEQREVAIDVFNKLDDAGVFINPIVTEITE